MMIECSHNRPHTKRNRVDFISHLIHKTYGYNYDCQARDGTGPSPVALLYYIVRQCGERGRGNIDVLVSVNVSL